MSGHAVVAARTVAAAIVAFLAAGTLAACSARHPSPANYYLALGDSVPFGYRNALGSTDAAASAYEPNYPSLVASRLAAEHRGATLVNYSCPGESTTSYLAACQWQDSGRPMHDGYHGSQGAAALAFLRAHSGHVSLITVTLIGNDINAYLDTCPRRDEACMVAGAVPAVSAYQHRLAAILSDLRRAAPRTAMVVTGAYDADRGGFALADPLIARLDAAARGAASAVGAAFADPMPDFNPPGPGEDAALCALTLVCSVDDAHPSPAGHQALARSVLAALGTLPA